MKASVALGFVVLALCLAAAPALAGPILSDPYGAGAPDVIGAPSLFDIESLEIQQMDPGNMRISLRFNFNGGDETLASFTALGGALDGRSLGVGDILFEGSAHLWAVPVVSGSTGGAPPIGYLVPTAEPLTRFVYPGGLYQVSSFITAGAALGLDPSDDFRADAPVWGAIPSPFGLAYGNVMVVPLAGDQLQVDVFVPATAAFLADMADGFHVSFASTTCACDVLEGFVSSVPEPGAGALFAAVAALALAVRSR